MNHYTHLSVTERHKLAAFLDMNLSKSEIARRLNRHRATIYREIKRNQPLSCYNALTAQKHYTSGKQRKCTIQKYPTLRDYVVTGLKKHQWSPEQIVGRLKRKKSKYIICHETIYRYIYKHNHKLHLYLPYKKPKRFKPSARKKQCRYGENRLITERPAYIDTRNQVGHWEGDSIEFKGNKNGAITTLVERKTKFLFLIKNETRKSEYVMNTIQKTFSAFKQKICKTITFDQGSEFACFSLLERALECSVYYCHPHSPWEKGGNENMNGRLRWLLPKNRNIDEITQEELDALANKMNRTPRKCLDYRTPKEVFLRCFTNICRTSL